jgi:hypothetical protein
MTKLGEKLQLTLENKNKIQETLEAHGVSTDGKTFADFADLIDTTLTEAEEAASSGGSSTAAKIYIYATATSNAENDFPIYIPTKFKPYLELSDGSSYEKCAGSITTAAYYNNNLSKIKTALFASDGSVVTMDPCYIFGFTYGSNGYP